MFDVLRCGCLCFLLSSLLIVLGGSGQGGGGGGGGRWGGGVVGFFCFVCFFCFILSHSRGLALFPTELYISHTLTTKVGGE